MGAREGRLRKKQRVEGTWTRARFFPERVLKAINRIQNIQFEAIVGHRTKRK
ncbi:hydroxysteroid (17-beta) dehydrogenase 13, isoform CRA_c [Rattus norvegicus]|uniref:Hydroxysteroid (17-beta) dehydrogenase 13, isoform CRA_c n=1 Tax=Rattus norvegicus TaxID=10116 RepID=A6K5U3_RAT|nr:hydroxysteroid (17-beta) dehydrogenase 13, isoform CRA_c [Rattus norvegicus]